MNATKQSILIVEDQFGERDAMTRLLRTEGYDAVPVDTLEGAISRLDDPVDMVITDLRLGTSSGLDVLRAFREKRSAIPVIVVTAYGAVDTAVAAMKMGAIDYLLKPLHPEQLLVLVSRYLPMRHRDVSLTESLQGLVPMLGTSSAMEPVLEQIYRVSPTDDPVLIVGESGTGTELVAAAIHQQGRRHKQNYVSMNIASVPASQLEVELFGVSSAGAPARRMGRLQEAHLGTLFLDEINEFPMSLQRRLLSVLESRTIRRPDQGSSEFVDARIIVAASRSLAELVERDLYREDLCRCLSSRTIELPPLRERPDDIKPLVEYYLRDSASRYLRQAPAVSPELMKFYMAYDWPGNIRQLRNVVENMLILGNEDELDVEDLPRFLSGNAEFASQSWLASTLNLADLERFVIQSALAHSMGNRTRAAQQLGISIRTLQRKLKQWDEE